VSEPEPPRFESGDATDGSGRLLFRYLGGDEWAEYRAILHVFADTFFAEFAPEEVTERLSETFAFDVATVADRLESLRRWGNLTVSSSTGTPSSLADYYRRRSRYLITREGQQVHDAVEGVLSRVDEVRDVSVGRLTDMLEGLRDLVGADLASAPSDRVAQLVRAVFDAHERFTDEITHFFAAINQWQRRYDLTTEEFAFFAGVLVTYVSDRLHEIERRSRPIAAALGALESDIIHLASATHQGLAAQVEAAGLDEYIAVRRAAGSTVAEWQHLADWFVSRPGRPARIDQLREDAVRAVRTLTLNLNRLSRVGLGGSSRRRDFLHLASLLDQSTEIQPDRLINAAMGLFPASHYGALAQDTDDRVPATTSWWTAPQAVVPVSLRERGDLTPRGRSSPIADRSEAQATVRLRRELELARSRRIDAELASLESVDGALVSHDALRRLQELITRCVTLASVHAHEIQLIDGSLTCSIARVTGCTTSISSPEGRLTVHNLVVEVRAIEMATPVPVL
jgi:uncharacterized protein (TIGR02677 family)